MNRLEKVDKDIERIIRENKEDGSDDSPVTSESKSDAMKLAQAIPDWIEIPEPCITEDGRIAFEWIKKDARVLLEVFNGQLIWCALFDGCAPYGHREAGQLSWGVSLTPNIESILKKYQSYEGPDV